VLTATRCVSLLVSRSKAARWVFTLGIDNSLPEAEAFIAYLVSLLRRPHGRGRLFVCAGVPCWPRVLLSFCNTRSSSSHWNSIDIDFDLPVAESCTRRGYHSVPGRLSWAPRTWIIPPLRRPRPRGRLFCWGYCRSWQRHFSTAAQTAAKRCRDGPPRK
jgi:hypothetical protein